MIRSIASILVPVVVWGVLWVGSAQVAAAVVPDAFDENAIPAGPWILGVFIGLSMLLSVVAGWLGGKIAPRAIMKHVLILSIVQLVIGIAVQASVWDQMPLWYHLPFLALVMPMHLLGGRLAGPARQASTPAGSSRISAA